VSYFSIFSFLIALLSLAAEVQGIDRWQWSSMRFVIASSDYAGLGFAIRLGKEGHEVILATKPDPSVVADPEKLARYCRVGEGLVSKASLSHLLRSRNDFRDAFWIWDLNHSVDENETLRSEGFRVLGGGRHAYTMEHDRKACLDFASHCGLDAPPSARFDDPAEAIEFCKSHPETAYVYKPDTGDNFETFLPESEDPGEANQELQIHLRSMLDENGPKSAFLLQERKDGVETNVEVWFQQGEPIFAFMALECKRRHVQDLGELAGCALDYVFTIPVDCRAVSASIEKLVPAYRAMKYTGFADANYIASKDGVWFLEKCERLGYNAHPNLFWNLGRAGIGEAFASWIEGNLQPNFAEGFGASVTMSTKEACPPGKPVQFPQKLENDIYFYDVYRRDGLYLTAGFDHSGDVLIVTGYGYTMPTAWESVMKKAAEIRFPYRYYRTDGDQTNYPSSPIRRYEALKAMGYI
jgi:phosphoribosylamine-glycine ligase